MTNRLTTWLAAVAFGALAGQAYVMFVYDSFPPILKSTWPGLRAGAIITGLSAAFEILIMRGSLGNRLRRQPFVVYLIVRVCFHTLLVVSGLLLNRAVGALLIGEIAPEAFRVAYLIQDTVYAFFVIAVFMFILQMRALIGGRTLMNVVLGRYYRPMRENRIFLMIDLAGSTPLAETIGDEKFHEFLSAFFFEIDASIVELRGEVYCYVGDAMIATWPLGTPALNARAVKAAFGARECVARKAAWFQDKFGHVPRFRAVVHGGPIVAGECGDSRRQITYLGDVLNTAARLEALCKQLNVETLISRAILDRTDLPDRIAAIELGSHRLKGVADPLPVASLTRDDALQRQASLASTPS